MKKELKLKITEQIHQDIGTWRARMNPDDMIKLGIMDGMTVSIRGASITGCFVYADWTKSIKKRHMGIDGRIRRNIGRAVGEKAHVSFYDAGIANTLTLRTKTKIPDINDFLAHAKWGLLGLVVSEGDTVFIPYQGHSISLKVSDLHATSEIASVKKTTEFQLEMDEQPRPIVESETFYERMRGIRHSIFTHELALRVSLKASRRMLENQSSLVAERVEVSTIDGLGTEDMSWLMKRIAPTLVSVNEIIVFLGSKAPTRFIKIVRTLPMGEVIIKPSTEIIFIPKSELEEANQNYKWWNLQPPSGILFPRYLGLDISIDWLDSNLRKGPGSIMTDGVALEEYKSILEEIGGENSYDRANLLLEYGVLNMRVGMALHSNSYFERADESIRKSLSFFTAEQYPDDFLGATLQLCIVLNHLKQYSKTMDLCREVLSSTYLDFHPYTQATFLINLGSTCIAQFETTDHKQVNLIKEAVKSLKKAMKLLKKYPAPNLKNLITRRLGLAYLNMGRFGTNTDSLKKAMMYFEDVEDVITPTVNPRETALLMWDMGKALRELSMNGIKEWNIGNAENIKRALKELNSARDLLRVSGTDSLLAQINAEIADIEKGM